MQAPKVKSIPMKYECLISRFNSMDGEMNMGHNAARRRGVMLRDLDGVLFGFIRNEFFRLS